MGKCLLLCYTHTHAHTHTHTHTHTTPVPSPLTLTSTWWEEKFMLKPTSGQMSALVLRWAYPVGCCADTDKPLGVNRSTQTKFFQFHAWSYHNLVALATLKPLKSWSGRPLSRSGRISSTHLENTCKCKLAATTGITHRTSSENNNNNN